jgi:hypothetical protein
MKEKKEISYQVLKWGPCVITFKAEKEFIDKLLDEAKRSQESYGNRLAGHLKKEVKLDARNHKEYFEAMFTIYDHALQGWTRKKGVSHRVVSDLWCNFQKANEFNPPHDHTGTLSFVIYLKAPEIMRTECEAHQKVKTGAGPGCISFFLADSDQKNSITQHSFLPMMGDCFIFPAWLKHWVYPFKSDCTRVSVSGNVVDNIPLNLMSNEGIQSALEDVRKRNQ